MRPAFTVLLVFSAIVACNELSKPVQSAPPASDTLQAMWPGNPGDIRLTKGQGQLVLALDPALYTQEGNEHYYLHFTIYNGSGKTYGFDLRDPGETVFLNQVGAFRSESLIEVHNELFSRYLPLKEEQCRKLLTAHKKKELQVVETGKTLEYYREFTGGKKAETRQLFDSIHHLSLYVNGRLAFTDGKEVCEFIARTGGDTAATHTCFYFDRKVKIDGPVKWKTIPAGAIVIGQ